MRLCVPLRNLPGKSTLVNKLLSTNIFTVGHEATSQIEGGDLCFPLAPYNQAGGPNAPFLGALDPHDTAHDNTQGRRKRSRNFVANSPEASLSQEPTTTNGRHVLWINSGEMVDDADDFLTPSKVASECSGDDGKYMAAVVRFAQLLSSKLAPSLTPHAASAGGSLCEKVRSVFS